MKLKKVFTFIFICFLVTLSASCGKKEDKSSENKIGSKEKVNESSKRKIKDLSGAEIEIPAVKDINRVVIISPAIISPYVSALKDTSKIVGMHPWIISQSNVEILQKLVPNYKNINTSFIKGFVSNSEEIMKLSLDIIFYWGKGHKQGLENVKVPMVDFFTKDTDVEVWSVKAYELICDIFEADNKNDLKEEWLRANNQVKEMLKNKSSKKKGLMIFQNTGEKILVRGRNNYGDDWLKRTGLVNAAESVEGDGVEVNFEQIYQWNPDIVYFFRGVPRDKYLKNEIPGQNWSEITAFKNKDIYEIPLSLFTWFSPQTDAPLASVWYTMKNYPELMKENDFKEYMKKFYKNMYNIELTDKLIDDILRNK